MHSDKFEKIFIRLVSAYVEKYKGHAFEISLGSGKSQLIGESANIVKVKIIDSDNVLRRIFVEGSLGLGEAYCGG